MTDFLYAQSPISIRPDIGEAYRRFWQRLKHPGSWWTATERIAIADEVRQAATCKFCADRAVALSPYSFKGEHQCAQATILDTDTVDAVHRVVTDQSRITQSWIEGLVERGMSVEAYVELVGVVVAVFSIDEFNRVLGLSPEPLPDAEPGEPTRYRPAQTETKTGFVPMLQRDAAQGNEADLWMKGRGANVLRALSVVPDAVRDWKDISAAQYLSVEGMANMIGDENRAIDRMQMELVAGRVSAINQCFY